MKWLEVIKRDHAERLGLTVQQIDKLIAAVEFGEKRLYEICEADAHPNEKYTGLELSPVGKLAQQGCKTMQNGKFGEGE